MKNNRGVAARFLDNAIVWQIMAAGWPDMRQRLLRSARADLRAAWSLRYCGTFRPWWG